MKDYIETNIKILNDAIKQNHQISNETFIIILTAIKNMCNDSEREVK